MQKLPDGLIRKILHFVRLLAGTNPVGEHPIRRIEPDNGVERARPFGIGVFPPAREATILDRLVPPEAQVGERVNRPLVQDEQFSVFCGFTDDKLVKSIKADAGVSGCTDRGGNRRRVGPRLVPA